MTVRGIGEATAALRAMAARVDEATPMALHAAAALIEGKARANLSRRSHARGTPTPSPPGQPPAMISGTLRSNWMVEGPVSNGTGAWMCTLYPTTVYAGIQEVGGWAGRGHSSHLPARPYLRPATEDLIRNGALRSVFVHAWAAAIRA